MTYKELVEYIQSMANADKMKDSLENLYLYLHEIESMIQSGQEPNADPTQHDEFRYKLQVIEQQIAQIDEELKKLPQDMEKPENIS